MKTIIRIGLVAALAVSLQGCGALMGYCVMDRQAHPTEKTPLLCDW